MRINIYSQELTDEFRLVKKEGADGQTYSAIMLMLHSSSMLHQPPQHVGSDDDRSAVSFWIPRSANRRELFARTLEQMAMAVRLAPPEQTPVSEFNGVSPPINAEPSWISEQALIIAQSIGRQESRNESQRIAQLQLSAEQGIRYTLGYLNKAL
jgi:hypothetical protein